MHSVAQPGQHKERADAVCQQDNSNALALLARQGACSAVPLAACFDTQRTDRTIVAIRAQLVRCWV